MSESVDDALDRRAYFRTLPSYGPDWDSAIDFGIDVMHLERNLSRTYQERFQAATANAQLLAWCARITEQLYGQK